MTGTEISLVNWTVPIITGNFTQDFNSFLEAASASAQREFDAQLFFSYIIQNGTWDQPQVWFIPGTDEVYEDEQDIPPDLKMLVSVRSRFSCQEEFIQWCGDNVLGFTRSTFWRRHSSIDKYTMMGYSLPQAVATRLQPGMGSAVATRLQGLLEFDNIHNIIGVNEEIKNLPDQLLPSDFDELEVEDQIEVAKAAVMEYTNEKMAGAQAGDRRIGPDLDRQLYKRPRIYVLACDDDSGFPYKITVTRWPEDDGGFGDGQTDEIFVQFIADTGEVLDDLPPDVSHWWYRRLKVRGW